jgi:hypothetical protein
VSFAGTSDNIGFNLNVDSNGQTIGIGDQAKIWWKPADMVSVELGKVQGDTLRGKLGGTSTSVMSSSAGGEDNIFARFYPTKGLYAGFTPITGLFIGAAIDASPTTTTTMTVAPTGSTTTDKDGNFVTTYVAGTTETQPTLENVIYAAQIGAGYTIENVGLLRAQYVGAVADAKQYVQAAFAFTGVAGLTVDAGVSIYPKASTSNYTSFGAKYVVDALTVSARTKIDFGATDLEASALATAAYKINDITTAGIELLGDSLVASASKSEVEFFPYVRLGYAKGSAKFGFAGTYNLDSSVFSFKVPLVLEYGF